MSIRIQGSGETANLLRNILDEHYKENPELVVNWGTDKVFDKHEKVLNRNLILNKEEELIKFRERGIRTPQIYFDICKVPVCFSILKRDKEHSQGRDIVYIKSVYEKPAKGDYYTRYIDKIAEYRVHVLGNKIVSISQKMPRNVKSTIIWSLNNGWYHVEYGEKWFQKLQYYRLARLGKKAVKTLGYDFGAVDIIMDKYFRLYVLEVNSAPGLIERRARLYAEYFKTMLIGEVIKNECKI